MFLYKLYDTHSTLIGFCVNKPHLILCLPPSLFAAPQVLLEWPADGGGAGAGPGGRRARGRGRLRLRRRQPSQQARHGEHLTQRPM